MVHVGNIFELHQIGDLESQLFVNGIELEDVKSTSRRVDTITIEVFNYKKSYTVNDFTINLNGCEVCECVEISTHTEFNTLSTITFTFAVSEVHYVDARED